LMVDIALQHLTVAETVEILGGNVRLNYRNFIVQDQKVGGQTVTKHLRFSDELIGLQMSEEERKKRNVKLLKEAGAKMERGEVKVEKHIYEVNPFLFSRMKYLVRVEPDAMLPKNEAFEKAMSLEVYNRAIQNPLIVQDPEALSTVTRDFLFGALAKTQGEEDKYLPDTRRVLGEAAARAVQQGGGQNAGQVQQLLNKGGLRAEAPEV